MSGQAGGVRQPRKLSEVTENSVPLALRRGSVTVVTAFGLVGHGRPVRSWAVSALCPFACMFWTHTFACPVGALPGAFGERVEYCVIGDAFYSVIVPESLLHAGSVIPAVAP